MRPALHVPNPIPSQLLLEVRRAAPRRVLPTLVGENLPRRAVVRDASRQRFHHQRALLVVRHRDAHQIARVIVQESGHVHPLVLAQQKSKKIRLPELVGLGTLEAMLLGLRFGLGRLALLRDALGLEHPTHRRLRRANPEETPHRIANPPAASLRLRRLHRHNRVPARIDCAFGDCRPGLRPETLSALVPENSDPLRCRRVRHAKLLGYQPRTDLLLDHRTSHSQLDVGWPRSATSCLSFRLHLSPP